MALWIAIAGAIGVLCRYWLAGFLYEWIGTGFPWGTLVVNVIGSLLLGLVLGKESLSEARLILGIGFVGGFTTFSTFSYESFMMIRDGAIVMAGINIIVSIALGLAAAGTGFLIGRA